MSTLSFLTANRQSKVKPYRTTLGGRKYIVAPVVMINEGVLNGNQGAIYYAPRAVNNRVERWNDIPVTLGHPEDASGNKISARSPKVSDKYTVGRIFAATFTGNKLKAKAYLDEELMKEKAPGTLRDILRGGQVELSTGLYTSTVNETGDFKGKSYTKRLVSYEPDHLALLPNDRGACSLEDGCGVNTNALVTNSLTFVYNTNCGIGSGGFQPGNKCAKGSGSSSYRAGEASDKIRELAKSKNTTVEELAKKNGFVNGGSFLQTVEAVKAAGYSSLGEAAKDKGVSVGKDLASKFGITGVVWRPSSKSRSKSSTKFEIDPMKLKRAEDAAKRLKDLTGNVLSYDETKDALRSLVSKEEPNKYAYVVDVYPSTFIYRIGEATYRRGYKTSKDEVSLTGSAEEVAMTRSYKAVSRTKTSVSFTPTAVAANACKCHGKCDKCKKKAKKLKFEVSDHDEALTFQPTENANCGIGSGGFQGGNTCAKGSGRAGFGKASTATAAQKKQAAKRTNGGGGKTSDAKVGSKKYNDEVDYMNFGDLHYPTTTGGKSRHKDASEKLGLKVSSYNGTTGGTTVQGSPSSVGAMLKKKGYQERAIASFDGEETRIYTKGKNMIQTIGDTKDSSTQLIFGGQSKTSAKSL